MSAIVGYIVMSVPKRKADAYDREPMAYGEEGQPSPDMLLLGRGATLFPTLTDAHDALHDTLVRAEAGGHSWPKRRTYGLVEVRAPR